MTIAILGIGQMGAAAAVCFSRSGRDVLLWARDASKLSRVTDDLRAMHEFLDAQLGPTSIKRGTVTLTESMQPILESAAFVLECIAEEMDQKVALLAQLRPAVDRGAILASCTSGLSITEMGRRAGVADRLIGAHFWNPPHLMPLVEVVRTESIEETIVQTTCELMRAAGKIPVVCRDVLGFIGNRLQHAMVREAVSLVQQGVCSAEDVDLVARLTFALRLPAVGPCAGVDLVGLPLVSQIQSYLLADLDRSTSTMPLIEQQIDAGQLGMKTGQGLLDWTNRDAGQLIALRDRQIVQQLKFLQSEKALS